MLPYLQLSVRELLADLVVQFQLSPIIIAVAIGFLPSSTAQYPPPPTYDVILRSPVNRNITISYKTPEPGTCVTTLPKQKQYTGYVNLPPFTLAPYQQDYSINTFFWFIEAREEPENAPLTIWLNGGPGSSSMLGLFTEGGPCEVVQLPDGSYGTQPNIWGWDRSSNMLFIDQPTQTGFSYDKLTNATIDYVGSETTVPPVAFDSSRPKWSYGNGTFSTGLPYNTQNTTKIAASAAWHFLQGFLAAFPKYNPDRVPAQYRTRATGIHLFAESYGGMYGPVFAEYFEEQNVKRLTGQIPSKSTYEIKLTSLGIINGIIEEQIQAPWWPKFAYNNSYGIGLIDQTTQLNTLSDFTNPGGCNEMISQCRKNAARFDPMSEGDHAPTNTVCAQAKYQCNRVLMNSLNGRSPYDIRTVGPDSHISQAFVEYLNTPAVQQSIGVPLNFTQQSYDVLESFLRSESLISMSRFDHLLNGYSWR